MKKVLMGSLVLTVLAVAIIGFQMSSCTKSTAQTTIIHDTIKTVITDTLNVCPQATSRSLGTYTGSSINALGGSGIVTYNFLANNFATSSVRPTDPIVTYGGYRYTSDSIFISVYYTSSNSYYLLKGKFLNNSNTINGVFQNLTHLEDYGTFTMSK